KDKYLLSASIREDGSSRFAPDHKYGWYPSASVGWVLSEEDFLKESRALSFLKLRANYGLTGNAEIGDFRYLSLYGLTNYPGLAGFSPSQLGNQNLKWEKTTQADVGLDFAFLHNRITGELDYYHKHSSDLLLAVNIPQTTGFSSIVENVGNMYNSGYEVS